MRTPHSNEIEKETIQLYYSGYTYDEIHNKLNVSTGYVSDLINRLKQKHGANEVVPLRELGASMRKLGITATDASLGCNVVSLLKRLEININDLQLFLKNVYEKCENSNLEPEMLVEYSKMLFILQETSDTSLENIEVKYSNLVQEKQKIVKDISQLTEDVKNAKDNAEKILSESNLTIKQVSEYVNIRDSLVTCGVNFDDNSKFATMLKNAKFAEFNIQKILNHLQKEGDSEQRIKQNRHEISQLETQKEELEKQNKDSKDELAANQIYLDVIRQFESDEIKVTFLEDIYNIITEISKRHGIDRKESIIKFYDDIQNNYDVQLGLETKLKSLNNEIDSKSERLDSLETKIENLNLKYKEEQSIISILKSLKQKVNPQLIIPWNNIFRNAKIDPKDFELQLEKIGTLEKIISSKQQEITELVNGKKQLEVELEVLEENKESLESKINYIEELAEKRFEKYTKYLLERFLKFHSDSLQLVEGVATHSMDKISKTENLIKKDFETIMTELEELMSNNLETSEKVGKLKAWHPLYELVAESKFNSHTTIPILVIILERVRSIFKQENISTFNIDSFISQLKKMIP